MNTQYDAMPIPDWFYDMVDRTAQGEMFAVPYAAIAAEAAEYKKRYGKGLRAPYQDVVKFGFVIIDGQMTFCHQQGELFVPGSVEDSIRTAEFILKWFPYITTISLTLDTHMTNQIFHPVFWVNRKTGEHPAPFTAISLNDIKSGIWVPNPAMTMVLNMTAAELMSWVMHYCRTLEKNGQYQLMIWPYHAMLGGVNYALMPIIEAAVFWWSLLRNTQPHFEMKGGNPLTEMYGAIRAEVMQFANGTPVAQLQYELIRVLTEMDVVGFAGQAFNFCVSSTLSQVYDIFSDPANNGTHLLDRFRVFTDMSSPVPVPGYEAQVVAIKQQLLDRDFQLVDSTQNFAQIVA